MLDERPIPVRTQADIVVARQVGRRLAQQLGFNTVDQTLIATAISEIARNIVEYAGSGEIRLTVVTRGATSGLQVVAADQGPGIVDVERALQDGFSTGHGLGLGLPGARRLMDAFELRSKVGSGTTVTMTRWTR